MENNFGEHILAIRLEKKISEKELADELKVAEDEVKKWESGETEPNIILITKIAEYFSITVDFLIKGKGYDPKYILKDNKVSSVSEMEDELFNDNNINLGKYLIFLKNRKNITNIELAKVLYTAPDKITKWEKGEEFPDVNSLSKMSKLFGISIDNLLKGRCNKSKYIDCGSVNIFDNLSSETVSTVSEKGNTVNVDKKVYYNMEIYKLIKGKKVAILAGLLLALLLFVVSCFLTFIFLRTRTSEIIATVNAVIICSIFSTFIFFAGASLALKGLFDSEAKKNLFIDDEIFLDIAFRYIVIMYLAVPILLIFSPFIYVKYLRKIDVIIEKYEFEKKYKSIIK